MGFGLDGSVFVGLRVVNEGRLTMGRIGVEAEGDVEEDVTGAECISKI